MFKCSPTTTSRTASPSVDTTEDSDSRSVGKRVKGQGERVYEVRCEVRGERGYEVRGKGDTRSGRKGIRGQGRKGCCSRLASGQLFRSLLFFFFF